MNGSGIPDMSSHPTVMLLSHFSVQTALMSLESLPSYHPWCHQECFVIVRGMFSKASDVLAVSFILS